jgi:hypothetical protein
MHPCAEETLLVSNGSVRLTTCEAQLSVTRVLFCQCRAKGQKEVIIVTLSTLCRRIAVSASAYLATTFAQTTKLKQTKTSTVGRWT